MELVCLFLASGPRGEAHGVGRPDARRPGQNDAAKYFTRHPLIAEPLYVANDEPLHVPPGSEPLHVSQGPDRLDLVNGSEPHPWDHLPQVVAIPAVQKCQRLPI